MQCVWRNKGNARVCECIIISCAVSRFCRNRNIFMAVICDLAKRRQADRRCFIESVHEWIKTDFMTNKAASSYISILCIVCCFLVTAPSKKGCAMSRTLPMVYFQSVSRYRDLFTRETKERSWYMATFPFVLIAWLMIWEYEMKYSTFFMSYTGLQIINIMSCAALRIIPITIIITAKRKILSVQTIFHAHTRTHTHTHTRNSMHTTTTRCSGCFGHLYWCSDCLNDRLRWCYYSSPIFPHGFPRCRHCHTWKKIKLKTCVSYLEFYDRKAAHPHRTPKRQHVSHR